MKYLTAILIFCMLGLSYNNISADLTEFEHVSERFSKQELETIHRLEHFAKETQVTRYGRQPTPIPEEINRILREFREQGRTEHLPYLLEYGLNLYLKNLTLSKLARVLPIDKNLMLSELIRLAKISKYKTAHEAGWLNRQFHGSFQDINEATGYSSYQIYIWCLENWISVLGMPNIDRLCDIQKKIEKTGMHGVGGGKVCHYGCR
jgi:hypothetical protein